MAIVLATVAVLDELGSGVAVVAAPDIRGDLRLSYGTLALAILFAPALISLLVEAPLLAWTDRKPRGRVLVGALVVLALGSGAAALAPSAWVLAPTLAVLGIAMGCAATAAQSAMVVSDPRGPERAMTQWVLGALLGDALAPVLLAALALVGFGWRVGFAVFAVAALGHAAVVAIHHRRTTEVGAGEGGEDEPHEPLLQSFRAVLRDRKLLAWLGGTATCGLLDEPLAAFAAVWLHDRLAATPALQAAALTGLALGGGVGLVIANRLLTRVAPLRVLAGSCVICIALVSTWLVIDHALASAIVLALCGAAIAPLYPIAKAQAYRARPDRPGLVNAAGQLFSPLEIAVPLGVGVLADAVGLRWALLVLLLQPLVLLALALRPPREREDDEADSRRHPPTA